MCIQPLHVCITNDSDLNIFVQNHLYQLLTQHLHICTHMYVCMHEVMCKVWTPVFQKHSSLAQYRFRCLKGHQVPPCWQTCKRKITDFIPTHLGQLQQDREIKSIFFQQRSSSDSETPKYNCILFSNILLQCPTAPIHRAACQQCNHT